MTRKYRTGTEILESQEYQEAVKSGDEQRRRRILNREIFSTPEFRDASVEEQKKIFERFNVGDETPSEMKIPEAELARIAPKSAVEPAALEAPAVSAEPPNLEAELFGQTPPPMSESPMDIPEPPSMVQRAATDLPYTVAGGLTGLAAGTAEAAMGAKDLLRNIASGQPPQTSGQKWLQNWAGMQKDVAGGVPQGAAAYQRSKMQGRVGENIQRRFGPQVAEKSLLNIEGWMREQQLLKDLAEKARLSEMAQGVSKVMGRIPFGSTAVGASAALDVAEALRRGRENDPLAAAVSGLSAIGQAGMLIPHPATRLGGLGLTTATMPLDYVIKMLQQNRRRAAVGLAPATRAPQEIQYDPTGMPIR